jgi:hypothetical protein
MFDPQPAALITTVSTCARSNASMVRRAYIERGLLFSGVNHERAAAALIPGNDYLATFRGQHASGRGIHLGEEDALHASEQQPYTQARFALRFHALRERGAVCPLRG